MSFSYIYVRHRPYPFFYFSPATHTWIQHTTNQPVVGHIVSDSIFFYFFLLKSRAYPQLGTFLLLIRIFKRSLQKVDPITEPDHHHNVHCCNLLYLSFSYQINTFDNKSHYCEYNNQHRLIHHPPSPHTTSLATHSARCYHPNFACSCFSQLPHPLGDVRLRCFTCFDYYSPHINGQKSAISDMSCDK
jgi:hypothetical protein